jgi:hypothetical protein
MQSRKKSLDLREKTLHNTVAVSSDALQHHDRGALAAPLLGSPRQRPSRADMFLRNGIADLAGLMSTDPGLVDHVDFLESFIAKKAGRKPAHVAHAEPTPRTDDQHRSSASPPSPRPRPSTGRRALRAQFAPSDRISQGGPQDDSRIGGEELASVFDVWSTVTHQHED